MVWGNVLICRLQHNVPSSRRTFLRQCWSSNTMRVLLRNKEQKVIAAKVSTFLYIKPYMVLSMSFWHSRDFEDIEICLEDQGMFHVVLHLYLDIYIVFPYFSCIDGHYMSTLGCVGDYQSHLPSRLPAVRRSDHTILFMVQILRALIGTDKK